ncbi:MAG TPA: cell envelope integrity protein CreD [Terracidiphilus sp.]
MGVKLLVVCGLALVMTIPSFFVESLLSERTARAADVVKEISAHVGGQQTFLGPTLAIPYTLAADSKHGVYLVFPARATAAVQTRTEERRRSLFKVPVFQADLKMNASFDLAGVPAAAPEGAQLDWNRAELILGVSDARGAQSDAIATIDGKSVTLAPARISAEMPMNPEEGQLSTLTLFGTGVQDIARPGAQFAVTAALRFTGAQRLALLSYGKTTRLTMQGDWPSPGFDGGFLPVTRNVSKNGFSAEWSVPFIARGVGAEGTAGAMRSLDATALGVSFIEMADPYQSVTRSLKYLLLFLGLVFLSYFVFEVTTGKRVHPAQYVLVGIAQVIFYLLLLSFAERMGFDWGFLLAGGATVILLASNAGWIFGSRLQGFRSLGVFGLLYTLIYLLLRLEDNALLVGTVASFLAVAAVMYFTRRIDWYSSLPGSSLSKPSDEAA